MMQEPTSQLALFDFDGTITVRDSFMDFLMFGFGPVRLVWGVLTLAGPVLGYFLKKIKNDRLKEKFLTHFFKGTEAQEFRALGEKYALERIPKLVRPGALERIEWHRKEGHRIVMVSASIDAWLAAWCRKMGMELISTEVEVADGRLTGRLKGRNCYGPEKVRRIREYLNPDDYEKIYAYGDSRGDWEMLELAHEAFFKPFR